MQGLPTILPILDFSTVKNDLFPIIAQDFSKTSSMAIKIRALEVFSLLCGGTMGSSGASKDDPNGVSLKAKPASTNAVLDKYTVQEKVVPLLKGIKTKEPAVMVGNSNQSDINTALTSTDGRLDCFCAGWPSGRLDIPCNGCFAYSMAVQSRPTS